MIEKASFPEWTVSQSFSGKLHSLANLSNQWSCSIRHIRRLVARGELGSVKVGGLVRVPQAEIERFIAERFVSPKEEVPKRRRNKPLSAGYVTSVVDSVIRRREEGGA